MANKEPIHIALVDDHALFRSGIANLLLEFPEIKVVFQASNGKEMQQLVSRHRPADVILMDINMPLIDGYQATQWIKQHHPEVHVLALSMFDEDLAVIKMLKAGAGGYVLKESQPAELYRAITEIKEKGIYINEMVSGKMLRSFQHADDQAAESSRLTPREVEFLKLCVSELTYKEIAIAMDIAARSVDNYRESLFEKLALKSRVGLVLYAIKHKLVEVN